MKRTCTFTCDMTPEINFMASQKHKIVNVRVRSEEGYNKLFFQNSLTVLHSKLDFSKSYCMFLTRFASEKTSQNDFKNQFLEIENSYFLKCVDIAF